MKRRKLSSILTTISTITLSISLLLTSITPVLALDANKNTIPSTKQTSTTLSTNPSKVSKVIINKKSLTLYVGQTDTLTPIIYPSTATNQDVTWKSNKTSVATVDSNGIVTALNSGTAIITVTTIDGKKRATCKVTVPTIKVTGISLNETSTIISVGNNETLLATITPSDASNKSITWKSSNTRVVKVDSKGMITGVKAGTSIITAITKDGSKKASCTVTVNDVQIPSIVSIADITKTITQSDNYTLPSTVEAIMSDNSKKQVLVTWEREQTIFSRNEISIDDLSSNIGKNIPKNVDNTLSESKQILIQNDMKNKAIPNSTSILVDTSTVGTQIFKGSVDNYNAKVKLTLIITNKVSSPKYFPLLSDVPMPVGVNYKNSFVSDGNAFYVYDMQDISYSSINTLFTSYGWKYYKTTYLSNGDPVFFWTKGTSLVALTWFGYDRVIVGPIH